MEADPAIKADRNYFYSRGFSNEPYNPKPDQFCIIALNELSVKLFVPGNLPMVYERHHHNNFDRREDPIVREYHVMIQEGLEYSVSVSFSMHHTTLLSFIDPTEN